MTRNERVPQLCHLSGLFSPTARPPPLPLNPSHSPNIPPGFGTGHSLFDAALALALAFVVPSLSPGVNCTIPSSAASSPSNLRLLFLLAGPAAAAISCGISPSAYALLGAGQGNICGRATTKKLATTVVANSDEVIRDLGCRWGGGIVWSIGGGRAKQSCDISKSRGGRICNCALSTYQCPR